MKKKLSSAIHFIAKRKALEYDEISIKKILKCCTTISWIFYLMIYKGMEYKTIIKGLISQVPK